MTTTLARSGIGGTDRTSVKRLFLLIYGPFGTWKTVNAHRLPNTRTLDFDNGMQSVEWAIRAGKLDRRLDEIVYETIIPPASMNEAKNKVFDQAVDKIDEWLKDEDIATDKWEEYCREKHGFVYPQFWDTLIIDSGTTLSEAAMILALKENNRLKVSKSWSERKEKGLTPRRIQDYGASSILMSKFMTMCRTTGKNIVLICHERTDMDEESIEPNLTGKARQDIPALFDEVWYARIKGTRDEAKGYFQTQPDPKRRCRSRLGCLDAEEDADFDAIRNKVAEFYGVDPSVIWSAPHGSEEINALLEQEAEDSSMI